MGSDPVELIIKTVGQMYAFIVLMRFALQLSQADYYNPLSQAVVKLTNPLVRPLHRIFPKFKRIDLATLLLAVAVKAVVLFAILSLRGTAPEPAHLIYAAGGALYTLLDLYFYAVIGSVIISWIAPDSYHPAPQLIMQVTQPLFSQVQKVIPPIAGLDLSPIVIFVVIQLVQSQLAPFAF